MKNNHSERCKKCKETVFELLCACFGKVERNYIFDLPASLECFVDHNLYDDAQKIFRALANCQGHKNFIRAKTLPPADFFVVKDKFIVEFDESQHFTKPRLIALKNYPNNIEMGFDKKRWANLCAELNKRDNDPPFRDEQRAWYDTVRDLIPEIRKMGVTRRLYAKDHIWCQLDPKSEKDRRIFKGILHGKRIYNYKKTLSKESPEYLGKRLLLTKKEKDGLFRTKEDGFVEVEFNNDGDVSIFEITNSHRIQSQYHSLRALGQDCLGLNDPSVNTMLRYLVLPEMEVERIFNTVRYKYLQAILFSNLKNPSEKMSYSCNRAFQSLAGISVYQGNTKWKSNDTFWKKEGFSATAKEKTDFSKEREEMGSILSYIRYHSQDSNFSRIYSELIAIKPGFHEIRVHEGYFNGDIPIGDKPRNQVFRAIRNPESVLKKLNSLPREINKQKYLSYAACAITEGPFVFRKDVSVSYFDEIRKIRSESELDLLKEKFHVRSYYHENINNVKKLEEFLKSTEKFKYFLI